MFTMEICTNVKISSSSFQKFNSTLINMCLAESQELTTQKISKTLLSMADICELNDNLPAPCFPCLHCTLYTANCNRCIMGIIRHRKWHKGSLIHAGSLNLWMCTCYFFLKHCFDMMPWQNNFFLNHVSFKCL